MCIACALHVHACTWPDDNCNACWHIACDHSTATFPLCLPKGWIWRAYADAVGALGAGESVFYDTCRRAHVVVPGVEVVTLLCQMNLEIARQNQPICVAELDLPCLFLYGSDIPVFAGDV